jgi:mRNA-degrading endonuclease RelE of RelBE toxin-antitoxin system
VAKPAVRLNPRFRAALKKLSDAEVARVEEALRVLPDCFGQPHLHAGISIRRLRKDVYECRPGLKLRLLVRARAQASEVFFVGSHDDVRAILRRF